MHRRRSPPLLLVPLAVILAATGAGGGDRHAGPALDDLAFMEGRWAAEWGDHRLEEHFSAPADGTMVGLFRWMSEGATRFTEHLVLEQRDDGVVMLLRHFDPGSVVWAQEADGPLVFTLIECAEGRAVFENAAGDFPRRIAYHRAAPDAMTVRLEGRRESGEPRTMEFQFRSMSMATPTQTRPLTEAAQSIGYDGGLTIAFDVSNLDKSIEWYESVLGFKVIYRLGEMGWCELATPVDKVAIGLSQVEKVKRGGVPTFGVKDIAAARAQLESRGVRFDGDTVEIPGMVKLATFFDPDDNVLMFYQALSDQVP